jgi:3-dehydroquinate dehydratase II
MVGGDGRRRPHVSNAHIEVLNGPNLNLLGAREPEIYGTTTLAEIEAACAAHATAHGASISFRQSNWEGELIDWIQAARESAGGIILNPAGFTSTSIAILDALRTFTGPIVEVHLANIYRREAFRHSSYVSLVAAGVICGLGADGYIAALDFLFKRLAGPDAKKQGPPA